MTGIMWTCFLFSNFLLNVVCDLIPGHLKPLGHHRKPLGGVTIIDDFPSPTEFYENYVSKSEPFIVKGVLEKGQFPAYKLWTDKYLSEKYGKIDVDVEGGKKEDRKANQYVMPMSKFLQIYNQSSIYMVYDIAKEMKDDITVPISLQCGGLQEAIRSVIMWFSSGGTKSVLHNDGLDNINCLLDGSKDLIMFHKKYKKEIEGDHFVHQGAYSNVDVESVDMEKFPKLRDLPWYSVNITKGDCLYIPYQWYHQVISHPGRNLAVNVWSNHLRWFNTTDCEETEDKLKPISLKNFELNGIDNTDREMLIDIMFDDLESGTISRDEFIIRMKKYSSIEEDNDETLHQMFDYIDQDKDHILTMYEFQVLDLDEMFENVLDLDKLFNVNKDESVEEEPPSHKEPKYIKMGDDVSFLIKPVEKVDQSLDMSAKEEL